MGEELGWRGFALPLLQRERSALGVSLVLGAIWGLWHFPLYLVGTDIRPLSIFPAFVLAVIATSVICTWLYNSTGGSLLIVVLFHAASNLPITLLIAPYGEQQRTAFPLLPRRARRRRGRDRRVHRAREPVAHPAQAGRRAVGPSAPDRKVAIVAQSSELTSALHGPDPTWQINVTWRRVLILVPPLLLAGLEIAHPQPDVNVQAVMDVSTWFAGFHFIQLALIGLVALSAMLLANSYGRANTWTTRLGIGAFLVFFSAYDAVAGIGMGLAMRSARDLSAAQQEGVFDVVKDWPAFGPPFVLSIIGTAGLGDRARRAGARCSPPWRAATRMDLHRTGCLLPVGRASLPRRNAGLRLLLHRGALP